jgi:uncharacterized membrane protein YbhN (UPF0104 family)
MLRSSSRHAVLVSALATGLAVATVVALAVVVGVGSVAHAFSHVRPEWILVLAVAEMLTAPAYVLSYRGILGIDRPAPKVPLLAWLVMAGFGPLAIRGGFGLDQEVLRVTAADARTARVRVLAQAALEWVVLAPAAWIASIVLLISGSAAMPSLLWPWAIVTPIGLAAGLWATAPERKLSWIQNRQSDAPRQAVDAIRIIHRLLRDPRDGWQAWLGTAAYWATDIVAFYAACRTFGLRASGGAVIVAYGTGYVLTRRALPLAGAGVTEFLLTFALHWVGEPLGPALAAVVAYRVFNLVLASTPALVAHRQLDRWLDNPAPRPGARSTGAGG